EYVILRLRPARELSNHIVFRPQRGFCRAAILALRLLRIRRSSSCNSSGSIRSFSNKFTRSSEREPRKYRFRNERIERRLTSLRLTRGRYTKARPRNE